MNDEFEQRFEYPVDGLPIPMVMITEDRYEWLLRIAGRVKKRTVEHKLEDYLNKAIERGKCADTRTVILKFDPIRIVAQRRASIDARSMFILPDYDCMVYDELRREVKQLLYDTVMMDVAEHPEDYRV